ncbi:MAG: hypothetical protein JWM21_1843 [Acidobacteria bacterium]|nr:hypothetical protein [Acidobacteriota bacterium]
MFSKAFADICYANSKNLNEQSKISDTTNLFVLTNMNRDPRKRELG